MADRQIVESLNRISEELSELNRHMRVVEHALLCSTTQTKSFNHISTKKKKDDKLFNGKYIP